MTVPVLGLGTGFIGKGVPGLDPKDMDEEKGVKTVIGALNAGYNWIDTAPLYGRGKSEVIIGKALQQRPDLNQRITITTKVGMSKDGQDYSYDAVMRSVEKSMQNLGREYFEILYIHDAMNVPMTEVLGKGKALQALRKLQDEKIVRFTGTATNDPKDNARYIETGEFDVALVPDAWSLINRLAERLIFPIAEKHQVGIVLATPLERGLLATGPQEASSYLNRRFSKELLEHVEEMQSICRDHQVPLIAAAMQWCTRQSQIGIVLTGPRNESEARQNIEAVDTPIPESFWEAFEPLISDWSESGYLISPEG